MTDLQTTLNGYIAAGATIEDVRAGLALARDTYRPMSREWERLDLLWLAARRATTVDELRRRVKIAEAALLAVNKKG